MWEERTFEPEIILYSREKTSSWGDIGHVQVTASEKLIDFLNKGRLRDFNIVSRSEYTKSINADRIQGDTNALKIVYFNNNVSVNRAI